MKTPPNLEAEKFRHAGPYGDNYGLFFVKRGVFRLRCIVSCGMGWDHVSVSLDNRCPTWEEMDHIKRLFWNDDEVVMQLHVSRSNHINIHPFCLHLWRPQRSEEIEANKERMKAAGEHMPPENFWTCYPPIPLPPKECV